MNKDLFAYLPIVAGILLVHAKDFNLGILLKGQMLLLRAFEILKGCKWMKTCQKCNGGVFLLLGCSKGVEPTFNEEGAVS